MNRHFFCRLMMAGSPVVGYRVITRANALSLHGGYRHAAHAMLHSSYAEERKLFGYYPVRHAVMLQLRFDGTVGFPGGFIEPDESFEHGLQRELVEELGPGVSGLDINETHHVVSHICPDKPLCIHFYCKKVNMDLFTKIEKEVHDGPQYGLETLGIIRCPLYTMRDNNGGFPAFLRNNFIGNAREQLIIGLKHAGLLTEEEINLVVERSGVFQNLKAM